VVFLTIWQATYADGWPVDNWSSLWYGDEAVFAGTTMHVGNTHFEKVKQLWPAASGLRHFRYAFLAVIGQVYLPSVFKVAELRPAAREREPEGQFCRSLLDYFWVFPSHPMNRGTAETMDLFVQFCRAEYSSLSAEERAVLDPLRAGGRVPDDVLYPSPIDQEAVKRDSRSSVPAYEAEKLPERDLEDLLNTSMASSTWEGVVNEIPPNVLEYYRGLDLRKLPSIPSDWREIGKAVETGRMATFDATQLFPREIFNLTPAMLAQQEGQAADRIPVLSDACTAISLQGYGRQVEEAVRRKARVSFNLADRFMMMKEPWPGPDLSGELRYKLETMKGYGDLCNAGYVNTRRLKRLYEKLPDVTKLAGLESQVLRTQSYLWMGPLRGGFHYDEEANIYVQMTGESDVWLVHQNYTNPVSGGRRTFDPPSREALAKDPFLREIPWHVFRLKPGDGIVFPAYNYHLVCSQSADRVALNFFYFPRFRRMEYSEVDWYAQEAKRHRGVERLAVRQLWMRTFARLWDERGISVVFNAGKNELL